MIITRCNQFLRSPLPSPSLPSSSSSSSASASANFANRRHHRQDVLHSLLNHFLLVSIIGIGIISLLCPPLLLVHSRPALPSAPPPPLVPVVYLRLVDRSDVFDPLFLQKAVCGELPGVDIPFLMHMANWFNSKSIPCCERLLNETNTRGVFNCTVPPDPVDHQSTVFLHRLVFECIMESRDASQCCRSKGVQSERCLNLCTPGHILGADAFESGSGSQLMEECAEELKMPKEKFLWNLFGCLNPDFSKVMQITQVVKQEAAEEEAKEKKQKQKQKEEAEAEEKMPKSEEKEEEVKPVKEPELLKGYYVS